MDHDSLVRETAGFVKKQMAGDHTGHDWWHVQRVCKNALLLARHENSAALDLLVIRLAALLHDVDDWKFCDGNETAAARQARVWLDELGVRESVAEHVCQIVANVSFKGAGVRNLMKTREGLIVQDADRLDALGAIGIARAFAYGGFNGQPLYDPLVSPAYHATFEEYRNSKGTTINHFYEKLLLLQDQMNTETGRLIARARTEFMVTFLSKFREEWHGPDELG